MWVCARKVHLSGQGQAPTMQQRTAQNVQHGHCLQSCQVSVLRKNWTKMKLKVMPIPFNISMCHTISHMLAVTTVAVGVISTI